MVRSESELYRNVQLYGTTVRLESKLVAFFCNYLPKLLSSSVSARHQEIMFFSDDWERLAHFSVADPRSE